MLPKEYGEMSKTTLLEYFPSSFGSDLNGKTNAYEAIILIPFFKEELFLGSEAELKKTMELTEGEKARNTISLGYVNYRYAPEEASKEPLESTLTHLAGLKEDLSVRSFTENLEQIGKHCFASKMLPGVEIPCPGWQSFKYLNVRGTMIDQVKFMNKSQDRICLKIKQTEPENLENFVAEFAKLPDKHIYVGFPHQKEAFPISFEDESTIYTLNGNPYTNQIEVTPID